MKSTIKIIVTSCLLLTTYYITTAQVGINSDGSEPDESAMLDINSTDKGLLIPRMNSTNREGISNPADGLLVFDTDFNSFWYYTNSTWLNLNATLADADKDTKIQVEESPDEDIIRFDLGGTEFLRLNSGRMEIVNTGNSIMIGEGAGEVDDFTDNNNIFIGYETGNINESGENNIFLGYRAGHINYDGDHNTFLGYQSGYSNYSGSYNINIGYKSGYHNSGASKNITIGYQAGHFNQTGDENVFLGYKAGFANQASNNIVLGYQAGYANISGSRNIFLGYEAGYNETGSDKLYIDNSDSSSPLIFGDFDNDLLQINGTLNISGNYAFPTTDGNTNQILTTDGSGTLSWADLSVVNLSDADGDTKIQVEESTNEDIIRFDLGGTEFLRLDNGRIETVNTGSSVFIGEGAGANDDLLDNQNIFLGYQTGYNNDDGSGNIFTGYQTGYTNTAGYNNTFLGYQAGYANTTGINNLILGTLAGYSNDVGGYNLFMGVHAGYGNTSGNHNIAAGFQSGYTNSTGEKNVFLGYQAGYSETGSNKLYIDNSNSSTPLIYGEFDNDLLRINGTLNINGNYAFPTTDGASSQILATDGSGSLYWKNEATNTGTDDQTIDVLSFSGNTLSISLEDDGESNQTVDLTMSSIEDGGGDTKVDVGSSNQISFDLGGTEYFKMDGPHLEVLNSGSSVFIGQQAGENDDLSTNINVAIGNKALQTNSSGAGNIAIGTEALQSSNSSFNTVIGNYAAYQATGGSNVIIGYDAAQSLTSGGNNVIIGKSAGGTSNVSNKLFIDNTNTNSPLIYGEFDNDLLTVNGELTVNSSSTVNGFFEATTSASGENIYILTVENTTNNNSDYNDGLLIKAGHDNYNSSKQSSLIRFQTPSGTSCGRIRQDGGNDISLITSSDCRLKENIKSTHYSIEDILKIEVKDYNFIADSDDLVKTGFIAQQLHTIFPTAVSVGDDVKSNPWGVDYAGLTPLLVKGMQDQQQMIDQQNETIQQQQEEIKELKAQLQKVNELEAKVEALLKTQ